MSDSVVDIINAMGWTEKDLQYAQISSARAYDSDPKRRFMETFTDSGVATSVFYSKADAGQLLQAANESMPELHLTDSAWSRDGVMSIQSGSNLYNLWGLIDGPLGSILFITIGLGALDNPVNDHGLLAPTGNWPNKAEIPIQHCILKDGDLFSGVVDMMSAGDVITPWDYPGFESTKRASRLSPQQPECYLSSRQRKALNTAGWERLDFEMYRKPFAISDRPDQSFVIMMSRLGLDYAEDPVMIAIMGTDYDADRISDEYSGICLIGPYSTLLLGSTGGIVRPCPADADPDELNSLGQKFADDIFRWLSWRSTSQDPMSMPMPANEQDVATKKELLNNLAIIGRKGDIEGRSGTEQQDLTLAIQQAISLVQAIIDAPGIDPRVSQAAQIIMTGLMADPVDITTINKWFDFRKTHDLNPDQLDDQLDDFNAGAYLLELACTLLLLHRYEVVTARETVNTALNHFSTPESDPRGYIGLYLPALLWLCDYPGFRSMLRSAPLD